MEPFFEYHEPHMMALYMRAAMYGKLANKHEDPQLDADCDTVIRASLDYFDVVFMPVPGHTVYRGGKDGATPMHAKDVNPFTTPPKTPSNPSGSLYYGFWAGEIMEAMAVYLLHHATFSLSSRGPSTQGLLPASLRSSRKQLAMLREATPADGGVRLGIALESAPPSGASVTLTLAGGGVVASSTTLRFSSSDWAVVQTVALRWDGAAEFGPNASLALELAANSSAAGVFPHTETLSVVFTQRAPAAEQAAACSGEDGAVPLADTLGLEGGCRCWDGICVESSAVELRTWMLFVTGLSVFATPCGQGGGATLTNERGKRGRSRARTIDSNRIEETTFIVSFPIEVVLIRVR